MRDHAKTLLPNKKGNMQLFEIIWTKYINIHYYDKIILEARVVLIIK